MLKQLPSLEDQLRKSKKEQKSNESKSSGKNGFVSSNSDSEGEPIMTEELRKVLVALSSHSDSHKENSLFKTSSSSTNSPSSRKVISPESLFHVIWKVVPRSVNNNHHLFLNSSPSRQHENIYLRSSKVNLFNIFWHNGNRTISIAVS